MYNIYKNNVKIDLRINSWFIIKNMIITYKLSNIKRNILNVNLINLNFKKAKLNKLLVIID